MVVFARKSWENIENCKSISWDVGVSPEKFVKNRQSFAGIILRCREIMGLCYFMFLGRNTMQGKVEICGVNTARLKTLTAAQMDELMIRAKAGDAYARQQLIEGNLRLVLSVIQRFDKRGESPDDLFQVGCIGLMKAINNFDPTKQVRFSTYGVPMIAGEVRRYLRDNSAIRVSRSIRDVAYRVLQCKEAQTLQLGREPTLEEIARELELSQDEVSQALDAVCAPVSLYDPVYSDGGDPLTVMDQVYDTKNTEEGWMEHIALRNAFRTLGQREKQILSLRFVGGKTQMEVAGHLGISQAQVSRLEKGAINSMRKAISVS
jgi:RNA polymerase sporulation-specific sigma factor